MKTLYKVIVIAIMFSFVSPIFSNANERRFGYTYETSVLPYGAKEIEIWNTDRRGRGYFYHRLDQRVEYEFGVGSNLMSAFYLNYTSRAKDDNGNAAGGNKSTSYVASISSEWKYKILDRVADPLGFAGYVEGTLGTDKYEIEGKLIFDKQIKNILIAFDIVGELESETDVVNGNEIVSQEVKLKSDLGAAYIFTNGLGTGIEIRNENIFINGSVNHSSLFGGLTFSYSTEAWWAALSFLPQITSFKGGSTSGKELDLNEFEKFQTRLLLSFHI
ncbi:MAG: hypothetical protein Q8L88_03895 [Bacteroidota bacterium]|nr:hypothetical protein [Bacteroidota bacterium]